MKLGVSIRVCDSPSVKELVASRLRSYGNSAMRERGVDIAILGVDIAILGVDIANPRCRYSNPRVDIAVLRVDIAVLGVDIAIFGVDIANPRRPEKKGGATGGGGGWTYKTPRSGLDRP